MDFGKNKKSVFLKLLFSIIFCAFLFYFLSEKLNFNQNEWLNTLKRFDEGSVAVTVVLALLQVWFQNTRLWFLYSHLEKTTWVTGARAFSYGQVFNNFLPARMGEVVKVLTLSKGSENASKLRATVAVILEKFADFLAISVLALFVLPKLLNRIDLDQKKILSIFAVLFLFIVLAKVFYEKISKKLMNLKDTFQFLKNKNIFFISLFLGFGVWISEAGMIYILCRQLGFHLLSSEVLWVMIVVNLGIMVPLTIANIGTFEAAMAFALSGVGVMKIEALSVAIIHHAIQVGAVIIWAAMLFLFSYRKSARLKSE